MTWRSENMPQVPLFWPTYSIQQVLEICLHFEWHGPPCRGTFCRGTPYLSGTIFHGAILSWTILCNLVMVHLRHPELSRTTQIVTDHLIIMEQSCHGPSTLSLTIFLPTSSGHVSILAWTNSNVMGNFVIDQPNCHVSSCHGPIFVMDQFAQQFLVKFLKVSWKNL